ncbi:MAG: cytochrome c biogenesis protein CcsA [Nitrospirae bacterium]|nr:cytochrome c biogenesis protein CcsA [Nitrospirota bacterium]
MIPYIATIFYLSALFHRAFLFIAILLQSYYLISRGLMLGRLPLVGLHDTLIFLSLTTALFYLPIYYYVDPKNRKLLTSMVALLCAIFSLSGALATASSAPLPPVLRTFWFELHVTLSFLSYGLFGIAALLGLMYIKNTEKTLEKYQYLTILIGYLLFSLSMIFGGIWAFYAWGTYWLWTPKELWTTLLWLVYTLYLHLRYRPYWRGKPVAIVGVVGYAVVLFTYLGVGLLMKSSHSF